MSEVDGWTDAQIREKFEELGSPAPPITATTKKIMLKRLKALMTSGGNPVAKPHEDEPEDEDEPDALPLPPTRIPKRLGRSALAAMNQANQSKVDNLFDSVSPISNGDGDFFNKTRSKSPSRKSLGRAEPTPVPPSPPRGSPSRQPITETLTRSPGRKSLGRASDFVTPEASEESQRPARKVTPGRRNTDSGDAFTNQRGISPSRIASGSFGSSDFDLQKSAERIIQEARESVSRESLANQAFRSRLFDGTSTDNFESDFMKRLRTPVRTSNYAVGNDDDVLSDDDDSLASPVRVVRGNKPSGYEVRSGKSEREFSLVLFFVIIVPITILCGFYAMLYNAPKTEVAQKKLVFPVCMESSVDMPGANCIEEKERALVESVFKAFIDALTEVRLGIPCTTSPSQPFFIDNDSVKEMIVSNSDEISFWLAEKKLKDLKVLLDANPYLNIRCKTDGVSLIKGPDTVLCQLWSNIVLLAEWIVKIGVTTILAILSWMGFQWYLTKQEKHKEDVAFAVDKVIDMTKTRKFLAVEQLEKELSSSGFSKDIITEAFNVASRDSRLTLDSKNNTTGLRWVGETTSSTGTLWTNDRVEADRSAAYVLPPTACLKIRGMFAPAKKIMNDADIMQLVDTILEKSSGNRIIHIVVDRKSPDGIVYLRCLTRSDAGGAFRNLNGSVYEGRPINVKFVRESRYDEKFPDSAKYTRPLRPSSQN